MYPRKITWYHKIMEKDRLRPITYLEMHDRYPSAFRAVLADLDQEDSEGGIPILGSFFEETVESGFHGNWHRPVRQVGNEPPCR